MLNKLDFFAKLFRPRLGKVMLLSVMYTNEWYVVEQMDYTAKRKDVFWTVIFNAKVHPDYQHITMHW